MRHRPNIAFLKRTATPRSDWPADTGYCRRRLIEGLDIVMEDQVVWTTIRGAQRLK
jgi:hypothetical protein